MTLAFQERWRPLVLSGAKTTTVRTKRLASPGDAFTIDDARFVVLAVEAMPLAKARDLCWASEGMASPEEFERAWEGTHPTRGFRPGDSVWVHRFARALMGEATRPDMLPGDDTRANGR